MRKPLYTVAFFLKIHMSYYDKNIKKHRSGGILQDAVSVLFK